MVRFIKYLLLFLPATVFGYILLVVAAGSILPQRLKPNLTFFRAGYGHLHSRLAEADTTGPVDLLFLGSSHTYRGFDPRIFARKGYTSFNLGSSSQTPKQTRILLERHLDNLSPKVVIYEVYPTTFELDGIESTLNLISAAPNDWQSASLALSSGNLKAINTLIYAEAADVLGWNADFEEPRTVKKDTYIPGGYVERELTYFSPPDSIPATTWTWKLEQLAAFEDVLAQLKARDIPYILVFAPITAVEYDAHTNTATFDSLMQTYGDYVNFNEQLKLNDSLHFYDAHHLNQLGVELFNAEIDFAIDKVRSN